MIGKRKRGPIYYGVGAKGTMEAIKTLNRLGRTMYPGKRLRGKKKQGFSGIGVTYENDRTRVYRRKRMPLKYKKKWKRMIKIDNAIDLKKSGSRTFVFNKPDEAINSTSGKQGTFSLALYGGQGNESHWSDLHYVGYDESVDDDPTAAKGVTLHPTTKVYFQSAVLDVTIRNTSFKNTDADVPVVPLEVDIYEMTSSKFWMERDGATTLKAFTTLKDIFEEAKGERQGIDNRNVAEFNDRGMTPFDCTHAISQYGLKILKKTKYRIGPSNTITYQMRDPKNRVTTINSLKEMAGGNKPGWTKMLFIVFKATPGFPLESYTEQIKLGITRKYMYKIANATEKRVSHVTR